MLVRRIRNAGPQYRVLHANGRVRGEIKLGVQRACGEVHTEPVDLRFPHITESDSTTQCNSSSSLSKLNVIDSRIERNH